MKIFCVITFLLFSASMESVAIRAAEAPVKPAPKLPAKPQPKPAPKPQPKPAGHSEMLKKFDVDHSKTFNVTEARAIQDAYIANPLDPMLKKYDADRNGKISDAEIMKIIPPPPTPAKPKPNPKPAPKKKQKKK